MYIYSVTYAIIVTAVPETKDTIEMQNRQSTHAQMHSDSKLDTIESLLEFNFVHFKAWFQIANLHTSKWRDIVFAHSGNIKNSYRIETFILYIH